MITKRINPDGSVTIGIIDDNNTYTVDKPKEEKPKAEKPKAKTTKKSK